MSENQPVDPTGGWARATHALAVFGKEALDTGRAIGRFVAAPTGEVVGMLHDHLKVVRFERQVRLLDRAAEFMAERGKAGPDRKIPLNVALPLLEAATLEEDNDLQDLWVRLLVNGTDGDRPDEIERSFVSILRDMSRLDAEILQKIGDADNGTGVWTGELPELAISYRRGSEGPAENQEPSDDVNISLSNLTRLGVIDPTAGFGGPMSRGLVRLTPLGRALLRAVSA